MKQRVITGCVAATLFLIVLFIPWTLVLTVANAAICAIAVYEVLRVTKTVQHKNIGIVAMVFSAVCPFFSRMNGGFVFLMFLLYLLALVLCVWKQWGTVDKIAMVFFLSALVAVPLSCMSHLRMAGDRSGDGIFYVLLSLTTAWLSDTGAYFAGTFFGKHKLCPRLSPKKTVEGLIGGIISSIVFSLLVAWIYALILSGTAGVSYFEVFVLALICAPLSVVGDLTASWLKRRYDVKDFGNLFPGHGGVMDRFDSLLFVFPVFYVITQMFPLIYSL